MNKKILSIFALIMAISILGVSCAKDNNTTAPTTTTTPPIEKADAEKVIKAIGANFTVQDTTAAVTITFDLTAKTVTDTIKESGANYIASVTGTGSLSGGAKTIHIDDLKSAVEAKKTDIEGAVSGLTVDSVVTAKKDNKNATVTINYKKGNAKAAIVITFTLPADSGSDKIVYDNQYTDIALTAVETALKKIGTSGDVTIGTGKASFKSITLVADGTFSVDAVAVDTTALGASTAATAIEGALKALNITGVDTATGIAVDKTDLAAASGNPSGTITLTLTPKTGYKFNGFNTVAPNGSVAITITVVSKVTNSGEQAANFK